MVRDYLFDIGKIVEGASRGDMGKVFSYAESLGEKLEAAGDIGGAKRIRQILGKSKASNLSVARMAQSQLPLPVDSESRIPVADEEICHRGDVQVFLSPEASSTVEKFLTHFRAADRLIAHGVGVSPSLLMHGPPGCGKTQLARFIASELGYPLITARADALISSYLGSTAKNLRMLFDHAASRPCVLFLDEFDAIAKMRDDDRELGELKRVVIGLMQNIDAMGRDHVLLAATNHEHLLDPAIWRRFAHKLRITEPEYDARRFLLKHFLGKFGTDAIAELAAALGDGMSGAQLRDIAEDAVRTAVIEERESLTQQDIVSRMAGSDRLASQVRAVRKALPKMSQTEIGKLFGVSQGYVSQLLRQGEPNAEDAA